MVLIQVNDKTHGLIKEAVMALYISGFKNKNDRVSQSDAIEFYLSSAKKKKWVID